MQGEYGLGAGDVVLQKTPFSFDVSVWEFFWPLMFGAKLVVARPGGHQEPEYLAEVIERERVTTLHFVPSMLAVFVESEGLERRCESVRQVMCSGEALPPEVTERAYARLSRAKVHNLYGPTEAAVDVTYHECARRGARGSVPIGRPVANTTMRVLDADMRLCAQGTAGELQIAGVQLGRGYHGRPELTAERFVPDPYGEPGARMYRTGDLARWLPDGNLEYLGRIDHQVKIRGFRIELGEIEAALQEQAGIRAAVVVAREDVPGQKRLVGYVVGEADVGAVKEALKARLPEYMVPTAFVVLDEMPLSPNGKVDRKALRAPEYDAAATEYVAPRDAAERLLVEIVQDVLRAPRVSVTDSFFELGGDSILSIRVIAKAKAAGMALSPWQIFETPRIAELAKKLEAAEAEEEVGAFELIGEGQRARLPADVEAAYPLSALQAGMVFHSELEGSEGAVYHDIFSYHLRARFDEEQLTTVLRGRMAAHEVLRTSFDLQDADGTLQRVHRDTKLPLRVERRAGLSVEERAVVNRTFLEEEKRAPFDWARPPLWRVVVHVWSDEEMQVTLSFHHAILDGWSVATLITEVVEEYAARLSGKTFEPSAAPAAKFRQYIALEKACVESAEERAYWAEALEEHTVLARYPRSERRLARRRES
jgi:non-ribosomal peptide synthetase component F